VTRSPLLGEHTDEVMTELGYTMDDIAALRAERVI
jgi:formyl-CoA transferase